MARRSPHPFLRLALIACCALAAAAAQAPGPEILQYKDGTSSRQESGQPGRNVTGQWSWVDADGNSHRIWYIADEFGFQAFGDLVPPVEQENSVPVLEEPQVEGLQQSASLGSTTERVQNQKSRARSQAPPQPQEASRSSLLSKGTSRNSATAFDSNPGDVSMLELLSKHDSSRKQIAKPSQQSKTVLNSKSIPADKVRSRGSTKFVNSGPIKGNSKIEIRSSSSPSNNLGSTLQIQSDLNSRAPKIAKMISGDLAGNIHDLFHSDLPNPIGGTRFVLVDRLQPPTIPKSRAIPRPIRPRPVTNKGPITVISGVHTSSRSKSLAKNFIESTTTLGPLLTRGKAVGRKRIVPQPLKVEGNLNLENFFSPINLAKTTAAPFKLESLDDYYYDYDYYDYPASALGSNSTASNTSSTNTTLPDSISPSEISLSETTETSQIIVLTTARATTTPEIISSSTQKSTTAPSIQLSTLSSLQPEKAQSQDQQRKSESQSQNRQIISEPQSQSNSAGLHKPSQSPLLPSFPPQISKTVPSSSSSRGVPLIPFSSLPVRPSPPPRLSFPINRPQRRPFSRITSASNEHRSDEDDCNDSDDSHENGGEQDD